MVRFGWDSRGDHRRHDRAPHHSGHDGPSSLSSSSPLPPLLLLSCCGSGNGCHHHFSNTNNFIYGSPAAPSKKYKTEMCKNMLESGHCKFGKNCHYAHSKGERNPPCVKELRKDNQLLLPCSIMVSTGSW
jgi:hypothetical protein